jgi:hypothetical protein
MSAVAQRVGGIRCGAELPQRAEAALPHAEPQSPVLARLCRLEEPEQPPGATRDPPVAAGERRDANPRRCHIEDDGGRKVHTPKLRPTTDTRLRGKHEFRIHDDLLLTGGLREQDAGEHDGGARDPEQIEALAEPDPGDREREDHLR